MAESNQTNLDLIGELEHNAESQADVSKLGKSVPCGDTPPPSPHLARPSHPMSHDRGDQVDAIPFDPRSSLETPDIIKSAAEALEKSAIESVDVNNGSKNQNQVHHPSRGEFLASMSSGQDNLPETSNINQTRRQLPDLGTGDTHDEAWNPLDQVPPAP